MNETLPVIAVGDYVWQWRFASGGGLVPHRYKVTRVWDDGRVFTTSRNGGKVYITREALILDAIGDWEKSIAGYRERIAYEESKIAELRAMLEEVAS